MLSAREATVGVGVIFDSQSGVVSGHEMHAYMKSAFRYLRLADIMTVILQLFIPDANAKFELNFYERLELGIAHLAATLSTITVGASPGRHELTLVRAELSEFAVRPTGLCW